MKYIKLYAYLTENLGDDLMVEILLNRYQDYHFICMGSTDTYRQLNAHKNFITRKKLTRKWNKLDRLISLIPGCNQRHFFADYLFNRMKRKAICSVHIGGSIFIEHSGTEHQVAEEKKKMDGSPLFIIGANFGPYVHQEFPAAFRLCFQNAADICFRDQYSYRLFADLPNVRYAPDVVFNYTGVQREKPSNEVVISVINFRSRPALTAYADRYEQFVSDVCRECIAHKMTPVLMSFCKNEGDEAAIDQICNLLPTEIRKEIQLAFYRDINVAIRRIAQAKFIVATRFHAMILALLLHVPFFSIAYDRKVSHVLEDIGYTNYCSPDKIDTISASEILDCRQDSFQIGHIIQDANRQFEGLDRFLSRFS